MHSESRSVSVPVLRPFPLAVLLLGGCAVERPREDPIDAHGVVGVEVAQRADVPPELARLDPAAAHALLLERSPTLRAARAELHAALAAVDVEAPWPNPRLGLGPSLGFGSDVVDEVVPFATISQSIATGGRLEAADELALARARAAAVELLALEREAGLALRASLARVVLARAAVAGADELTLAAADAAASAFELGRAGLIGGHQVAPFELDALRQRQVQLAAVEERAAAEASLARTLAADAEWIQGLAVDGYGEPPEDLPTREQLVSRLADGSPNLFRLRAAHEVAEAALGLEVARSAADLAVNANGSGEHVDDLFALQLGLAVELPLFDRNQQGIERALRERDAARARYEAAVRETLGRLDEVRSALDHARRRRAALVGELVPAAEANAERTRRALELGAAGTFEVLDAERVLRELRAELFSARATERSAWSVLEQTVGTALFAAEGEATFPEPVDALAQVGAAGDVGGGR